MIRVLRTLGRAYERRIWAPLTLRYIKAHPAPIDRPAVTTVRRPK